ncbi:MAG: DUF2993 domain-containing protein [Armatimonadota bacterium]
MRRALAISVVLAAALVWGQAAHAVTVKQVHDALVRYLGRTFQKPQDIRVKLETFDDPKALQRGRLKIIHMTVRQMAFEGIAMHDLSLKAYDITVDLPTLLNESKLETNQAKNTLMHARLTEKEMNEALKTKKMPFENFRVDFQNGKLVATGTHRFVVGNNLKMIAHLDPKDDGVHLVPEKVWVNGLPFPVGQIKKLVDKMNPLIKLSHLPFHPRVKQIKVHDTELEVS